MADRFCIPGFQYLCEILACMYIAPERRTLLRTHARDKTPLDGQIKDCGNTRLVMREFVAFAKQVRDKRKEIWNRLEMMLDKYWEDPYAGKQTTKDRFEDAEILLGVSPESAGKSMESMFTSLFVKQVGAGKGAYTFLAMTIALSVNYSGSTCFRVGAKEARYILSRSLEVLGSDGSDFIPEACFTVSWNSDSPEIDLLSLLLLAVMGALKTLYPHHRNVEQREKNREKAKNTLSKLVQSREDSVVFGSLRVYEMLSSVCVGLREALKDSVGQVTFPNGKVLPLEQFYHLPRFETSGNSLREILLSDMFSGARSLVLGKTGSGKSLLTQAVIWTCLHAEETENETCREYARALGLNDPDVWPLPLRCKRFRRGSDLTDVDLIEEAVYQLVGLMCAPRYADCHSQWDRNEQWRQWIVESFRQKAKRSKVLLIVEDLAWLDQASREVVLKKLEDMESNSYSRLHILVVTERLTNSQMTRFHGYNRVEIAALGRPLDQEIAELTERGIGASDCAHYLKLLERNRHVREFTDSAENLIRLLCHTRADPFDLDALLLRTIEERLGQDVGESVTQDECRDFLIELAMGVAERGEGADFSNYRFPFDDRNIPANILARRELESRFRRFDRSATIWKHIMENMILVYPTAQISSYAFVNRTVYCSLVADGYLRLVGTRPAPNWADHFNRLTARDFSSVIVMLFNRLCRASAAKGLLFSSVSDYDRQLLMQAVLGYSVSRSEVEEVFQCLQALMDILTDHFIRDALKACMDVRALKRVYESCYRLFDSLSDDEEKKARLVPIEQLG